MRPRSSVAVQRLEGSAYRIADAIYAEQEKTAG